MIRDLNAVKLQLELEKNMTEEANRTATLLEKLRIENETAWVREAYAVLRTNDMHSCDSTTLVDRVVCLNCRARGHRLEVAPLVAKQLEPREHRRRSRNAPARLRLLSKPCCRGMRAIVVLLIFIYFFKKTCQQLTSFAPKGATQCQQYKPIGLPGDAKHHQQQQQRQRQRHILVQRKHAQQDSV